MNKNMVKNIMKKTGMNIVDDTVDGIKNYTVCGIKTAAIAIPIVAGFNAVGNKITEGKWNIKCAIKEATVSAAIVLAVRTTAVAVASLVYNTADEIKSSKNSFDIDDIDVDEFEETEAETDAE